MYELTIAPALTKNVSSTARKFIESVERQSVAKIAQKTNTNSVISQTALPVKEYGYFKPSTSINMKDARIAKNICILG